MSLKILIAGEMTNKADFAAIKNPLLIDIQKQYEDTAESVTFTILLHGKK